MTAVQVKSKPDDSQHFETTLLVEMHRKRRVMQRILQDMDVVTADNKQLIRDIGHQQQELTLPIDEQRLRGDDMAFLSTEKASQQSNWSVDTTTLSIAENHEYPDTEDASAARKDRDLWIREHLEAQRDVEAYYDVVMQDVTQAVASLACDCPERPMEWLAAHVCMLEATSASPSLALLHETNAGLAHKLERIKAEQRRLHERQNRLSQCHSDFAEQIDLRAKLIGVLSCSHVTTRTQLIMVSTSNGSQPKRTRSSAQASSLSCLPIALARSLWRSTAPVSLKTCQFPSWGLVGSEFESTNRIERKRGSGRRRSLVKI